MMRFAVVRVTLLGAMAAMAACADAPVGPTLRASDARPSFLVGDGNPPPPPSDGIEESPGGGGSCLPRPGQPPCPPPTQELTLFVSGVQATIFVNRPGTNAFIDFSSTNPSIIVSPDARVHETGNGLVGRGTITIPVDYLVGLTGPVAVIDLSTVTGSIIPATPTSAQTALLRANLTYPDGSDVISLTGTWWRYASLAYRY